MFKMIGFAVGAAFIAWAIAVSPSSFAAEKGPDTAKQQCMYQGQAYKADALACWNDGFWHQCDGDTGRWINLRQKCKLM
jgi:hypothetical protein